MDHRLVLIDIIIAVVVNVVWRWVSRLRGWAGGLQHVSVFEFEELLELFVYVWTCARVYPFID